MAVISSPQIARGRGPPWEPQTGACVLGFINQEVLLLQHELDFARLLILQQ